MDCEFPGKAVPRFSSGRGILDSFLHVLMLPVHSDLFLYHMRERNNRLFLRKYKPDRTAIFTPPVETEGGGCNQQPGTHQWISNGGMIAPGEQTGILRNMTGTREFLGRMMGGRFPSGENMVG
jgi:hypothetical protein